MDLALKTSNENAEDEEEDADASSSAAGMHWFFDNLDRLSEVANCVVNVDKIVAIELPTGVTVG